VVSPSRSRRSSSSQSLFRVGGFGATDGGAVSAEGRVERGGGESCLSEPVSGGSSLRLLIQLKMATAMTNAIVNKNWISVLSGLWGIRQSARQQTLLRSANWNRAYQKISRTHQPEFNSTLKRLVHRILGLSVARLSLGSRFSSPGPARAGRRRSGQKGGLRPPFANCATGRRVGRRFRRSESRRRGES